MNKKLSYLASRLHVKVLFLLAIIILITIAALFVRREKLTRDIDEIASSYALTRLKSFETTRAGNSELIKALSYDYTIWDEMVRSVRERDQQWFEDNIPGALETYQADEVWIFNQQFQTVYTAKKNADLDEQFPIPDLATQASELFQNGYFVEFHAVIDGQIHQVYGAPIQPTADSARATAPQGYLFVARELNEKPLASLSVSNDSDVTITTNAEKFDTKILPQDGVIHFRDPIFDWQRQVIGQYDVVHSSQVLRQNWLIIIQQFQIFTAFMLVFLTTIITIVYILISRPLRQLSDSIATGDAERIEPLLRRKDEIGEAAKLMQQVKEQEKSLQVLNQAAEEARHRADLRSREAERMNDLMVGRELKMIALKKQLRDARSPKRRSTKKEGPS